MFGGKILIDNDRFVIDGLPFVMQRVRSIFKSGNSGRNGEHTHAVFEIAKTPSNAKDLEMLLVRYEFSMSDSTKIEIETLCRSYENTIASVRNVTKEMQKPRNYIETSIGLRPHQIEFHNLARVKKRILLADPVGMGKTYSSLSLASDPAARPVLIVVQPHLCSQWEINVKNMFSSAKVHIIKGHKNYEIPAGVEFLITAYGRLSPWQDILLSEKFEFKTVIFDEIQELRNTGTLKRRVADALSKNAEYAIGLSGTPVINYGGDIWSILDVLDPNSMGLHGDFLREWCGFSGIVNNPKALHSFLTSHGLMVRRENTRQSSPNKQVITLDTDLKTLEEIRDVHKLLALSILENKVGSSEDAMREFDWKLRMATGVSKAKPVAQFVKNLVEEGESVLLAGWHRDVYDVWLKELADLQPVMYTGSETPNEKDASFKKFTSGESKVFIISLRSGAGLDGLQQICNNVVLGELDWSNEIMNQLVGRLDREGQTKQVNAFYLTISDGADPFMIETLGLKQSQADGIVDGKSSEAKLLSGNEDHSSRIRDMAKAYLKSIGEEIKEGPVISGVFGELISVLGNIKVSRNSEAEIQAGLFEILKTRFQNVQREVRISERSRVDFLIEQNGEKIVIEVKNNSLKRAEVYKQVRRYANELSVSGVVLFAPWSGVDSFDVDGVKVKVVNFSSKALF